MESMTKDIVTKHKNISESFGRKDDLAEELGELLFEAVRTSIAQGALYDPGEYIDRDAKGAWHRVGNRLMQIIANAGGKAEHDDDEA
jgi:hypothetical protein